MMRGLDAVQPRHTNVQHDHVRLEFRRQLQRTLAVRGLADYRMRATFLEQLSQAVARGRFIVDDQYVHGALSSHGNCSFTL